MNKILLASVVFVGFTSSAFAAPSKSSTATLTSAIEVLKLPGENRRMLAQTQGEKFYSSFVTLAFSDAQPMNLRWKALMAAAEARKQQSTPDLLKAADHNQWFMRNAALIALNEVNPAEGKKVAQKLVKDKALVVRSAAVGALEKDLTADVRDLLWEELNQKYNFQKEHSLWIRHQIVEALSKKPMDHETKLFVTLLSDKDSRVQLPAVRGLEKLTGVKLGEGTMKQSALIGLWKDYAKKEKIEL